MTHWQNWDLNQSCNAAAFVQPASVEEVADLVLKARSEKRVIRATGAGHSWSPLVPVDDGYIVNLDNMQRAITIDHPNHLAELEAGIRLHSIGPMLEEAGLAMANLGAITQQSIAGAVSTGTHGTGLAYGILGTQVVGMKIIDGKGQLREFSLAANPNEMGALRLNLGCLGIIVSLTLSLVDSHMVELVHYKTSFKECLEDLEKLYTQNERVRIYWFPGSDEVFVNTMNKTDKKDKPGPVFSWFEAVVLREVLMGAMWKAGSLWPSFINGLNRFEEFAGFQKGSVVGPSYEAITTPIPPLHEECESDVPLENARAALESFDHLVRANGFLANVPSEIRFVRQDDIMLSNCNKGDVVSIGAYTDRTPDRDKFFKVFCDEMAKLGGRPHWGKYGAPDRGQATQMFPRFGEFAEFRSEMDPDGVFANAYIRELFALP